MFETHKSPLRILDQPTLGEPVMTLIGDYPFGDADAQPQPPPPSLVVHLDPRVEALQRQLDLLAIRLYYLEQRTLPARWATLRRWVREQWILLRQWFR